MSYTKRIWHNRMAENIDGRLITNVETGEETAVLVTLNQGEILQEGDEWNEDSMNDLEERISTAFSEQKSNLPATVTVASILAGYTERDCDFLLNGADDYKILQNAIYELPQNVGGTINILNGPCYLGGPIEIDRDNVSIQGMGSSTTFYRAYEETSLSGMFVVKGDNFNLRNIVFDGRMNERDYINSLWDGFIYSTVANSGLKVENCTFRNGGYGIFMTDTATFNINRVRVTNCTFEDNYAPAIRLWGADDILMKGNTIDGIKGSGVWLTRCIRGIISDSIIINCEKGTASTADTGVYMVGCQNISFPSGSFQNNLNGSFSIAADCQNIHLGNLDTDDTLPRQSNIIKSYTGKILRGRQAVKPDEANKVKRQEVTFPEGFFTSTPTVLTTPDITNPGLVLLGDGVTGASKDGFVITLTSTNTNTIQVDWTAIQD